ncbi:MAG TPA: beta-propeller domain-containing protein [Candidatus Peribacterales bacterium]|nr:beta-propeller domain-containing protein [Candidatus Peribacterales bacterium]
MRYAYIIFPIRLMQLLRSIALFALLAVVMSTVTPTLAAFTDVGGNTPYQQAINALQEKGVVEGYDDGTFKAGATINRAEFLKIVLESRGEVDADAGSCFPDVKKDWFAKYVCTAKKEEIVAGYPDGYFRPEQEISFVEAAKILSLAYGQEINAYSPDWYEPYARALESSTAIPPSIDALTKKITRGEMAEMMWRLSENVTDEPAKSYMNVKYPEMKVNLASKKPERAESCMDLRAFTEEAMRTNVYPMMMKGMDTMEETVPATAPSAREENSSAQDGDYSHTNVQVAGVDEGDIVKTDGRYLYLIRNQNEVRIVDAGNPAALKNAATISFDAQGFLPSDLYIEGNRLIVIGSSWDQGGGPIGIMGAPVMEKMAIWPGPWMQRSFTVVKIYNISDPTDPTLQRTVSFEGNQISTRRIGNRLYIVTNRAPWYYGGPIPLREATSETDFLPLMKDSAHGDVAEAAVKCSDVVILPRVPSPSYLIVSVIPLNDANADVERTAVLGNGENVYSSLENLYVAATDWNYIWNRNAETPSQEQTRLYRFAFTEDGVSFQAQGKVSGRILNQFSMDEYENHFRIATTLDQQWSMNGSVQKPSTNSLYVLNRDMETVGSITDIAPGERIYSTRFLGGRTYMVTFRTIDPLFVIDTSNPRNPKILGQLKIPGYSDYLHPYDENHILGFGKEAVVSKDGTLAWQQGMKIALFDVSDVKNPKELHNLVIGERGTDSPLLQNPKALLFEKNRSLLAFPVRIHKILHPEQYYGDPASAYGDPVFQGAQVYTIDVANGFTLRGTVTHYTNDDWLKAGGYVYGKDIERIVRIDDSLYTISAWGIKSADEVTVEEQGALPFVSPDPVSGVCPDASNAGVKYVSNDPDQCMLIRFACAEGMEAFSNTCGCGCMPRE